MTELVPLDEDSSYQDRLGFFARLRESQTLARICADPYDRLHSVAILDENPARRMAEPGDAAGFIEFTADETKSYRSLTGYSSLVRLRS